MSALIRHEADHLSQAYNAQRSLIEAIRNADCATANSAGEEAVKAMRRQDIELDRRTNCQSASKKDPLSASKRDPLRWAA